MTKDWSGNKNSIFKTLGASNHTDKVRELNDYYATDSVAIDKLRAKFTIPHNVWECACGEGHLSKRLIELGHNVFSSDLINRGYGVQQDFLLADKSPAELDGNFCILTNPPYIHSLAFVKKALELVPNDGYVIMFLKTTFLEGKKRYDELFSKTPPKYIYQFVNRVLCAKNGDFDYMRKHGGSAVSYAWYLLQKGYNGPTIIDWI